MRILIALVAVVCGLGVTACSDDDTSADFLDKCIRFNDHLTEATAVSCDGEHVGKVVAVVDADETCPEPATAQFGMGGKKLCYDSDQ